MLLFLQKPSVAAVLTAFLFCLSACKKPAAEAPSPGIVQPSMQYVHFNDLEIVGDMNYTYIDINTDGRADFFFQGMPVADPGSNSTRIEFNMFSRSHVDLLIGGDDDLTPALQFGEGVGPEHLGYAWLTLTATRLAAEVRPGNHSAVYWQGPWKDARALYLPLRLRRDGQPYYGWLQMSIDQAGSKLVLHRAALSTEARKTVAAGR